MTEFDITTDPLQIIFAPASVEQEVLQNVRTILTTRRGTVPLDRGFGLDWGFIDKPLAVAQAEFAAEITQQIRRYEPRAKLISIELGPSDKMEGQLKPRITVGVIE